VIYVLLTALILQTLVLVVFALFVAYRVQHQANLRVFEIQDFAKESLSYLAARTLTEKTQVDAHKAVTQVQVEQLKQTFTQQAEQKAKAEAEPKYVKTASGAEIDLTDYDVLS
jgi:hypothetical protein